MKAGRNLKGEGLGKLLGLNWFDPTSQVKVVNALNQSIYNLSERNRLEKHQERVHRVSFMGQGSGQLLASASQDGSIRLWKLDGTPSRFPLYGHEGAVVALDVSPDQQLLVSASYDQKIKLWQISRELDGTPKGRLIRTLTDPNLKALSHSNWIYDVRFSPDGQQIASASIDGTIKLWSSSGFLKTTLKTGSENISVSFSKDGKSLVAASQDGVRLWNGPQFSRMQQLDQSPAFWVSFSPNGQQFVSSGQDPTVKLWRANGTLVANLTGHSDQIYRAIFSHDGQLIASASADNTIKIWNAANGQELRTLRGHQDEVYRVQFSPDDQMIASGGKDDTVRLWQPTEKLQVKPDQDRVEFWRGNDDALLKTLTGHRNEIMDLDFAQDGQTLASASGDGSIKLWRSHSDGVIRLRNERPLNSLGFSQQGQFLIAGSASRLFFWQQQLDDGAGKAAHLVWKPLETIGKAGGESFLTNMSLSPDNRLLAAISDEGNIRLWHLTLNAAGQLQMPIPEQPLEWSSQSKQPLLSLSFSPDGRFLATGSEGSAIQIWDLETTARPKLVTSLRPANGTAITSLDFSPQGRLLVSGGRAARGSQPDSTETLILWDLSNPKAPKRIQPPNPLKLGNITSVRFSPDGKILATATEADNAIRLWKLSASGSALGQTPALTPFGEDMKGHRAPITQLAYSHSPTDYLLASASKDGTVKLWTKEGKPIAQPIEHRRDTQSVTFSTDDKLLISASLDRNVLIYTLPPGFSNAALDDLLQRGCGLLGEYLEANQNNISNDRETSDLMKQTAEFCKSQPK